MVVVAVPWSGLMLEPKPWAAGHVYDNLTFCASCARDDYSLTLVCVYTF